MSYTEMVQLVHAGGALTPLGARQIYRHISDLLGGFAKYTQSIKILITEEDAIVHPWKYQNKTAAKPKYSRD